MSDGVGETTGIGAALERAIDTTGVIMGVIMGLIMATAGGIPTAISIALVVLCDGGGDRPAAGRRTLPGYG